MPYVTKRKRRSERPSRYNGDAVLYRSLLAGGLLLVLLGAGVGLILVGFKS